MSSLDPTREWLKNVSRPYPSRDRIQAEVLAALQGSRGLAVKTDAFTFDSGQTSLLILLHGTIPISYRGATYHIPVQVWVPHEYPRAPPMAFVVPTKDMGVRKSREVEPGGRVREEVVNEWWAKWPSQSRNINSLLEKLAEIFSVVPPVYAKPPESAGQRPVASNPQATAGPSTAAQPPPPPARPGPMFGPPGVANGDLPSYGQASGFVAAAGNIGPAPQSPVRQDSISQQQAGFPPRPPQTPPRPASGEVHHPPVPPRPGQTPAIPQRPYQPRSPDSGVHQYYQPPALSPQSSGTSQRQAPGPPSQFAPPQHFGQRPPQHSIDPAHGAWQQQPPPPQQPAQQQQPSQPGYAPSPQPPLQPGWAPAPVPYQPAPQPSGPPPPQPPHPPQPLQPLQVPQQVPQAPTQAVSQPPAPAPARGVPIQDLLSSPEVSTTEMPDTTSAPPPLPPSKPPPPSLLHLHSILLPHLTASLPPLLHSLSSQKQQLADRHEDLVTGEPAIRDEMQRLEAVKKVCDAVGKKLEDTVHQGQARVADLEQRGDVSVDEVVCGISIVHNQLIDLVAEDNAIEDTIYHLTRALDAERIDLDRYLKAVRQLGREQYMKRALIERILKGMGQDAW